MLLKAMSILLLPQCLLVHLILSWFWTAVLLVPAAAVAAVTGVVVVAGVAHRLLHLFLLFGARLSALVLARLDHGGHGLVRLRKESSVQGYPVLISLHFPWILTGTCI
jgi:hypothetical protein